MTVMEEVIKGVLIAGAVIWVPGLIGAFVWAVRYGRRERLARRCRRYIERNWTWDASKRNWTSNARPYGEEEVIYE